MAANFFIPQKGGGGGGYLYVFQLVHILITETNLEAYRNGKGPA
jgi:hypothetical protein